METVEGTDEQRQELERRIERLEHIIGGVGAAMTAGTQEDMGQSGPEERVGRLEEDVETLKGAVLDLAKRTAKTRDRTLGLDDEGGRVFSKNDWRTISHNLSLSTDHAKEARQHALEALAVVATIESEVEAETEWANQDDDIRDLRKHLNEIQWRLDGIGGMTELASAGKP